MTKIKDTVCSALTAVDRIQEELNNIKSYLDFDITVTPEPMYPNRVAKTRLRAYEIIEHCIELKKAMDELERVK